MRQMAGLRRGVLCCAVTIAAVGISGCHSAFIATTIINHTGQTVRLLEVDYPNASFGTQDLAVDGIYHYRFKVLGSGDAKLTWTGADEKDHSSTGPHLTEGQEGTLVITLQAAQANWRPALRP